MVKLKYHGTVIDSQDKLSRIQSLSWSPNGNKLAVVIGERTVHMYDPSGNRKDKIPPRPRDPEGPKNFVVNAVSFSPDSTLLAIAQSDSILFVYKVGAEFGERKTICNKFQHAASTTAVTWPHGRAGEIVFALSDGKVRLGRLKANKAGTLYDAGSYAVSLAVSRDGLSFVSGHLDGSIHVYQFESGGASGSGHAMLTQHSCAPVALTWGDAVCAGGSDGQIVFYDRSGRSTDRFDFSDGPGAGKEVYSAAFNPSGDSVVVGSCDVFRTFAYNSKRRVWENDSTRAVKNMYAVTAMSWRADGTRISVGTVTGGVDDYDSCLKRFTFKGKFEVNYVSPAQIVVTRTDGSAGEPVHIASQYGEITRVNIYKDRYVVGHTAQTLLLCDMGPGPDSPAASAAIAADVGPRTSEVAWAPATPGAEKFHFDNPNACMIYSAGELLFVEYGLDEILGSCRTERVSPHLISVRIGETKKAARLGTKKVAYLIDVQTIVVMDIPSGRIDATISHDTRVDWLELNGRADKLLFRDRRRHLHLFDVPSQKRTTLLNYCSYVQWVPNSDVVVAQNRSALCVWYTIDTPDRVNTTQINGDVEEIVRAEDRTEVIIDEGLQKVAYALDEPLIEFGASVEDEDFERAVRILEHQGAAEEDAGGAQSPEIEAMWRTLSEMALAKRDLLVAERCFAALGDVSKARFLRKLNKEARKYQEETGQEPGGYYRVTAQLALLDHLFERAAAVYLENGQVEDAMDMYQELHRWDECISVAESKAHPDVENLRRDYFNWLIDTQQFEKAGQLKERESDFVAAINLYLKGGLPAKAAQLVRRHQVTSNPHLLETIATSLARAGMHDRAGQFLEQLGRNDEALAAYRKGRNYRAAVDLTKRVRPADVVRLEQEWAEWEVSQHQVDAAINHFIEAGLYVRALEAAIDSWQWSKAVQIADAQGTEEVRPYYRKIAKHYEDSKNLRDAEKYYVKGGFAEDAVKMYSEASMFDRAVSVANDHLPDSEVSTLNIAQAQRLEEEGRTREAEKFYVACGEIDVAISMYRKKRDFNNMIRLVRTYRKDMLGAAHLQIAQELEAEGKFKDAEQHFIHGGKWQLAVNMYRANELWDDCVRVAKLHGGDPARRRVLFERARAAGLEEGSQLLSKHSLVPDAIENAINGGLFEYAFKLATHAAPGKVADVHYKYALHLEDEGRFDRAEEHFVKASKPKEAIDMYTHQQDWAAALRVAENYDPRSVSEVLVMQARVAMQNSDFARAESLFVKARKPEAMINAFKEAGRWNDVMRLVKEHLPKQLHDYEAEYQVYKKSAGSARARELLGEARGLERQRGFGKAIDTLLRITASDSTDHDLLEEAWEYAAQLAMKYEPGRTQAVTNTISQRLCSIQRYETAAELCVGIADYHGAVRAYTQGGMYDKARRLQEAKGITAVSPGDSSGGGMGGMGGGAGGSAGAAGGSAGSSGASAGSSMGSSSEDMKSGGNAQIDELMRKGQWDQVFAAASKQGDEVAARYAGIRAAQLAQDRKTVEAIRVFAKHGVPSTAAHFNTYRLLVKEIFGTPKLLVQEMVVRDLRVVLYKLVEKLRKLSIEEKVVGEFTRMLAVAHVLAMRAICDKHGLKELAAKCSISALRHVDELPADWAFYEAGQMCRKVNWLSAAFVFQNRFLDLAEAMEDADQSGVIENSDFQDTDIPYDFALPDHAHIPEPEREKVRDWVLAISVDDAVDQELPTRTCDSCGTPTYEATLRCHSCETNSKPCAITGYPVLASKVVKCTSCECPANRDDWNRYVASMRACPWCSAAQTPNY